MSVIALPNGWQVAQFTMHNNVSQRVSASSYGGSEQAIDLLQDRWLASLVLTPNNYANTRQIDAFIGAMRGQVNQVALYHAARPTIAGTLAGTKTLSAAAAQFAASVSITATGTLLAGDLFSVATPTGGTLLLECAADCIDSGGVITVPINQRLRVALASGAAVVTSYPTALFRMLSTSYSTYVPGTANGVSFDFGEYIGP